MATVGQYEWNGRIYFENDDVARTQPGKGNILVTTSGKVMTAGKALQPRFEVTEQGIQPVVANQIKNATNPVTQAQASSTNALTQTATSTVNFLKQNPTVPVPTKVQATDRNTVVVPQLTRFEDKIRGQIVEYDPVTLKGTITFINPDGSIRTTIKSSWLKPPFPTQPPPTPADRPDINGVSSTFNFPPQAYDFAAGNAPTLNGTLYKNDSNEVGKIPGTSLVLHPGAQAFKVESQDLRGDWGDRTYVGDDGKSYVSSIYRDGPHNYMVTRPLDGYGVMRDQDTRL